MIKTLATVAATALVGLTNFATPAHAAPSVCAYRETPGGRVVEFSCDVHTRTNGNGHRVHDVAVFHDGEVGRSTFVLWTTGGKPDYAEVFYAGKRETQRWFRAKNGAVGVTDDRGRTFYFS